MGRIIWAIRIFFLTLFSHDTAQLVHRILLGESLSAPATPTAGPAAAAAPAATPTATQEPAPPSGRGSAPAAPPRASRNDAVALLAALQREARLIDLVQESLDAYQDAQIGAAARDVLRDTRAVLQRMFDLQPVVDRPEGASVELGGEFDSGEYRLTGHVPGQPPYRGRLVHHGWRAKRCELPAWTGSPSAADVIAPAELEMN